MSGAKGAPKSLKRHTLARTAKETLAPVGDGLDEMTSEQLNILVKAINQKVKAKTSNETEYDRKKCRMSKVKDKQAGLIRSWRRNYGDLEVD